PLTHVNLGNDLYRNGQRMQARDQFLLALRGDPHMAMAEFNLGVLDGESNKYVSAKAHYQAAIKSDPSFINARLNLSALEADHGDSADALQELTQVAALDPANEQAKSLRALFISKGILHG